MEPLRNLTISSGIDSVKTGMEKIVEKVKSLISGSIKNVDAKITDAKIERSGDVSFKETLGKLMDNSGMKENTMYTNGEGYALKREPNKLSLIKENSNISYSFEKNAEGKLECLVGSVRRVPTNFKNLPDEVLKALDSFTTGKITESVSLVDNKGWEI